MLDTKVRYNESKESASLIHNIMDGGKENEETI